MPIYRKCTECGKKVLEGTLCQCEQDKKRKSYLDYKRRRMKDKEEKERQKFYSSNSWLRCRDSVIAHQLGLDLVEWSKGNIVQAETYHHCIPIKEDWNKRVDSNNIIGLTQENHIRVHKMMDKSNKDKENIQKALSDLIRKFEDEYY
ncbi:hypothetical protein HBE96_23185 [Clostridium sp. P21]|uniref:HNH endonuclease n=1 Tax=Clostridium muellerianum TaxID=2716538 RepID=A0A7Y0EL70_9CLOT|nr:hypothetical protein [Clostridium muellerianum]NMM65486.1 hypothetical protein [Clostridium muellerianum]